MNVKLTVAGVGVAVATVAALGAGTAFASTKSATQSSVPAAVQSAVQTQTAPTPSTPEVQEPAAGTPEAAGAAETGPSDGPGGYADTNPNADTQQQGEH